MRKMMLLLIVMGAYLSLPVMAADPPVMMVDFEVGTLGTALAIDVQTPGPDAVKLKTGTAKYSDVGVTSGSLSLEVADTTAGSQEKFLGRGVWRMWDQLPTATYISMDITLENPGGNTSIPDQWFEIDVCFNGTLTNWADVALTKAVLPVTWGLTTYNVKFEIPQSIRDGRASAANSDGDFYIRKSHGAGGAIFWVDNVQINFDELVPPTPRGAASNLAPDDETIDKELYVPNQLTWDPVDPNDPNVVSVTYDVKYYSKLTSAVTADDPNFANPANGIVLASNVTSPYALALAYETTYYWQVISNVTWDSNDVTGNWNDSIVVDAEFDTLADDLPPAVTIPDAGDSIITWLEKLPEAGLAGTVTDENIAALLINWDIIGGPGYASNTAKQSLQRATNYTGDASYNNLIKDWIGTDARVGTYTMYLTIKGLPDNSYSWTSYHHDSEDQTGLFDLTITDENGTVTDPNQDITSGAAVLFADIKKVTKTIGSNGTDDIVLAFTQQTNTPTTNAFFVMNGFELSDGGTTPLKVDFGNNAATLQAGFAAYTAAHENSADFGPRYYSAFGTTITVIPSWDKPADATASVVNTTSNKAAPTATFDTITSVTGTYTVRLTATDTLFQFGKDTLTINVTTDACAAAKATPGFVLNYYDNDDDCDVDLVDFAAFAQQWLVDLNLTGNHYY